MYDVVERVGTQPWYDGRVGGMGISYFAQAQLGAAAQRPPHLKAIFPFATLDDLYDGVWHRGVLSSAFCGEDDARGRRRGMPGIGDDLAVDPHPAGVEVSRCVWGTCLQRPADPTR